MNVKLKNGSEEPKELVATITAALEMLWQIGAPLIAFELREVCLNSNHKPFGVSGKKLKEMDLMNPDGSVHPSIKNIVLSSFRGIGKNIELQSPLA